MSTVAAVIVMGVSGSGKTTVAELLADRLGWEFVEGDDFHPPANVAKMAGGTPLDDDDRRPWLATLGRHIADRLRAGQSLVVTCSALKRSYRDALSAGADGERLVFLHVNADQEVIRGRMQARVDHFMPSDLLDSQVATLEPLADDEPGVSISNAGTPEEVVERAAQAIDPLVATPAQ